MAVTMESIKILRDRTSAGLADCKKALVESNGDIESAVDWLRKKGLASVAKKAGRTAAEGVVCVVSSSERSSVVELNSETDFVARNDKFQALAKSIAGVACRCGLDVDAIMNEKMDSGMSVSDELSSVAAIMGENMKLRRVAHLNADNCVVSTYVHNKLSDDCGTIGVLVAVRGGDNESALAFGRKVAMHIAASSPVALNREGVSEDLLAREREIAKEKQRALGKGEDMMNKIAEGAVKKFYKENVLLEQQYVLDTSKSVAQAAEEGGFTIVDYVRYQLGEGIEKAHVDFAAEVQAQLQ